MQSLNESIELKCDSYFHAQHWVTPPHMIKLDVIKNMALINVIGPCKRHDAIDAVLLFEHTLCVNSLFACKSDHLHNFQQAIEKNECKYEH